MTRRALALLAGLFIAAQAMVTLADQAVFTPILKDHRFTPSEFESDDFRAEKVVSAGHEVSFLGWSAKAGNLRVPGRVL